MSKRAAPRSELAAPQNVELEQATGMLAAADYAEQRSAS